MVVFIQNKCPNTQDTPTTPTDLKSLVQCQNKLYIYKLYIYNIL